MEKSKVKRRLGEKLRLTEILKVIRRLTGETLV
jgi:hypothetical protein